LARGGFLVSGARNEQGVYFVEIEARRDARCSVMSPWPGKRVVVCPYRRLPHRRENHWRIQPVLRQNLRNPLSCLHDQLQQWRTEGAFQRPRVLASESAAESRFDGKQVVNLASNNYLGLTTHPKLREAAIEAVRKYGVGSGSVRTISGTMRLHMELEERIARFKNVEACVVFQSGFAANAGTVSAILGPEDHIVSDELNHASIIDGCRLCETEARSKVCTRKPQPVTPRPSRG